MNRVWGTLVVLTALPGQRRAPFLPRPRLDARRDARIRRIVGYAARTVPHYRELFARERIDPRDVRGAADLDALPLVDPDDVRRRPERFRSESRRARGALSFLTSGATGRPDGDPS
jgi:phenylacetate-CoA ligase